MTVIPAKGVAGVSDRTRSARETVMAYLPLRALQGEWVFHAASGMPRSTLPKDDIYSTAVLKAVIPAQAGIQCLSLCTDRPQKEPINASAIKTKA